MSEKIGYDAASHLLSGEMRRAGCEYLSRVGAEAAWDFGHEAIVRALARLPREFLSPAGLEAACLAEAQQGRTGGELGPGNTQEQPETQP